MENLSGVPSVGAWDLLQECVPMNPFSKVCQSQRGSPSRTIVI